MSDLTTMCIQCRQFFTDEQTKGANACPGCGSRSVPADPREKATITLTHHEWRILFMWAENWGAQCDQRPPVEGEERTSAECIAGMIAEAQRQAPGLTGLTLRQQVQEVVDGFGVKAELHQRGEVEKFEPPIKH